MIARPCGIEPRLELRVPRFEMIFLAEWAIHPMSQSQRPVRGRIIIAAACAVGAANVAMSVFALFRSPAFLQAVATSDLAVSLKILGVLGLHCALACPVGLLIGRVSEEEAWTVSVPSVALLSLISSWTALFNIQVLLAPSFTFTVGPVVMTNSYIAVISAYTACTFISLGFIFLGVSRYHEDKDAGPNGEEFAVLASWVQGVFFVALGLLTAI